MSARIIAALLAVVVAGTWLGCVGFARLRAPLDRLHCVTFVNTVAGTALTVAAFVADGPSTRAIKILLITVVSLTYGAALSHAAGRALWVRAGAKASAGRSGQASAGRSGQASAGRSGQA